MQKEEGLKGKYLRRVELNNQQMYFDLLDIEARILASLSRRKYQDRMDIKLHIFLWSYLQKLKDILDNRRHIFLLNYLRNSLASLDKFKHMSLLNCLKNFLNNYWQVLNKNEHKFYYKASHKSLGKMDKHQRISS